MLDINAASHLQRKCSFWRDRSLFEYNCKSGTVNNWNFMFAVRLKWTTVICSFIGRPCVASIYVNLQDEWWQIILDGVLRIGRSFYWRHDNDKWDIVICWNFYKINIYCDFMATIQFWLVVLCFILRFLFYKSMLLLCSYFGFRWFGEFSQPIHKRNTVPPVYKSVKPKKEHRINMRKYSRPYYVCSSLLDGTLELVFSIPRKWEPLIAPRAVFSLLCCAPVSLIPVSFTCTTSEISPRKLNLFASIHKIITAYLSLQSQTNHHNLTRAQDWDKLRSLVCSAFQRREVFIET